MELTLRLSSDFIEYSLLGYFNLVECLQDFSVKLWAI